jgi:hypothetical protein
MNKNCCQITLDIDIEMCRMALVGDGYLLSEVKLFDDEKILQIWKGRLESQIAHSYHKGKRMGLYE